MRDGVFTAMQLRHLAGAVALVGSLTRAAHAQTHAPARTSATAVTARAPVAPTRANAVSPPARVTSTPTRAPRVRPAPLPPPPCLRAAVEVRHLRGGAAWSGPLTDCDGRPTVRALAALSVLATQRDLVHTPDLVPVMRELRRIAPAAGWTLAEETRAPVTRAPVAPCPPGQEPVVAPPAREPTRVARAERGARAIAPPARTTRRRPVCRAISLPHDPHTHDPMIVLDGGVRLLHPRLIAMLAQVAAHFAGHRIEVISGYRPSPNPQSGSRHAHARALDFRVAGVSREALRDFARTLPSAGVGYYPNSVFVHMDVRDADEGSARWTDYSAHGETPRYGHWPPQESDVDREGTFLVGQAQRALDALRTSTAPEADPREEDTPRDDPSDTPSQARPDENDGAATAAPSAPGATDDSPAE